MGNERVNWEGMAVDTLGACDSWVCVCEGGKNERQTTVKDRAGQGRRRDAAELPKVPAQVSLKRAEAGRGC